MCVSIRKVATLTRQVILFADLMKTFLFGVNNLTQLLKTADSPICFLKSNISFSIILRHIIR